MVDLYNSVAQLESKVQEIKDSKELSPRNKELLLKYEESMVVDGLKPIRTLKVIRVTGYLAKWFAKDLDTVTKEDVDRIRAKINTSSYAEATKRDFLVCLKRFYKWQNGGEDYPDIVKRIKTTGKEDRKKLPEGMFTPGEVRRLLDATTNIRDEAIISVLYESGFRAGEFLNIKLQDINFDKEDFADIKVTGKTGSRVVTLFKAVPSLLRWMQSHPYKDKPSADLWVLLRKRNDTYSNIGAGGLRKILIVTAKRAKINKKIHPHLLRHSIATEDAKHMTVYQLMQKYGWKSSDTASVYVHLSQKDAKDAMRERYGIKKPEEAESSIRCWRCGTTQEKTNTRCWRCTAQLTESAQEEAMQREKILSVLLENPRVKTVIEGALKDMKKR
jgi:site-specific recombinase XerD